MSASERIYAPWMGVHCADPVQNFAVQILQNLQLAAAIILPADLIMIYVPLIRGIQYTRKKNSRIKIEFYSINIVLLIGNRVYSDRSELDLSGGTIRIQNLRCK